MPAVRYPWLVTKDAAFESAHPRAADGEFVEVGGGGGSASKQVPEQVRRQVEWALGGLRDHADSLKQARTLDDKFSGGGRYEREVHDKKKDDLQKYHDKLATFRKLADAKGIDTDAVIAELGGMPDHEPSPRGRDYKFADEEDKPTPAQPKKTPKVELTFAPAVTDDEGHPMSLLAADREASSLRYDLEWIERLKRDPAGYLEDHPDVSRERIDREIARESDVRSALERAEDGLAALRRGFETNPTPHEEAVIGVVQGAGRRGIMAADLHKKVGLPRYAAENMLARLADEGEIFRRARRHENGELVYLAEEPKSRKKSLRYPWMLTKSRDASGHEHDEAGLFAATGGAAKGKPKAKKPAAKPKAKPTSHADTYKSIQAQIAELKAKAQELRRTAHGEAKGKASTSHASATAAGEKMAKALTTRIDYDPSNDAHTDFGELDELVRAHDAEGTPSERRESFRDVITVADRLIADAPGKGEMEMSDAEWKDVMLAVKEIRTAAKDGLKHITAHAAARKEARGIKSGDWLAKCFRGLMIEKGLAGRYPWLVKGWDASKHKRGQPDNAGQFGSGGGGKKDEPHADPRHNPDLDALMAAGPSAPKPAPGGDIRHNPDLDELFNPGSAKPAPARPQAAPSAGKKRTKKPTVRVMAAKANEQLKLAAAAAKAGDHKAAQSHTVAAHGYNLAAAHLEDGKGREAAAVMAMADQFAAGGRQLNAVPGAGPNTASGTQVAPTRASGPGKPAATAPPPQAGGKPHEQTEQSAVQAAKAVQQATASGGDVKAAHAKALQALDAHAKQGNATLDEMAKAKYGPGPRAERAAAKAKQVFAQKVATVRAKLDALAGGRKPGEPPPLPGKRQPPPLPRRKAFAGLSVTKAFAESAYPWLVTKSRDATGHEHATDGRFGNGGAGDKKNVTTPDRHSRPTETPVRDPAKADAKAAKLAAKASSVPAKLRAQVHSFVRGRYRKLSKRYGPKGAAAIMGAAVLMLPLPVPGSSLIPIALAECVLALRRAVAKAHEADLTPDVINREARRLLRSLYIACGETWTPTR